MKTPLPHPNEAVRVQELIKTGLFLSAAEPRFDTITSLVKDAFSVPIVLITLLDENIQWFKSAQGITATETPKDISFCGHAILQNDIFEIPDTLLDERFVDNPLVTGRPHMRYYAGIPLTTVTGLPFGTLCIIDTVPRKLNEREQALLKSFALGVENELHKRGLSDVELDYLLSNNPSCQDRWLDSKLNCWSREAGFSLVAWYTQKHINEPYVIGAIDYDIGEQHVLKDSEIREMIHFVFVSTVRNVFPHNTTLFTSGYDELVFFNITHLEIPNVTILLRRFIENLRKENIKITPAIRCSYMERDNRKVKVDIHSKVTKLQYALSQAPANIFVKVD
jgi:hypothetical protein